MGIEELKEVASLNKEKSPEQMELDKLETEYKEKLAIHQKNDKDIEDIINGNKDKEIEGIEQIKERKGYSQELKTLTSRWTPSDKVLTFVMPDKNTGLQNLRKFESLAEKNGKEEQKTRLNNLITKLDKMTNEMVKDLAKYTGYEWHGISWLDVDPNLVKENGLNFKELGLDEESRTNIQGAVDKYISSSRDIRNCENKIEQDPEIIEKNKEIDEIYKKQIPHEVLQELRDKIDQLKQKIEQETRS